MPAIGTTKSVKVVTKEELAKKVLELVKDTKELPATCANRILWENRQYLAASDSFLLMARGLTNHVLDLLAEERRAEEVKRDKQEEEIFWSTRQEAKKRLDERKEQERLEREKKFQVENAIVNYEDDNGVTIRIVGELHTRFSPTCEKRQCMQTGNKSKRAGSVCTNHRLYCIERGVNWKAVGFSVYDLVGATNEQRAKMLKQIDEAAKEEREEEGWWFHLHRLMKCTNITCARLRYKGPYGICVQNFFQHDIKDPVQRKEAEEGARTWGEGIKRMEEDHIARVKIVVDMCIEEGYATALEDLRSITLLAADGSMKCLTAFSVEDTTFWEKRAETMVKSWSDRRMWFGAATQILQQCNVATIADLPTEEFRKLAKAARIVWKEQEDSKVNVGEDLETSCVIEG